MPALRHSRYIFETTEDVRTFRHQRVTNRSDELVVDCESCQSAVGAKEPYSHHWLNAGQDAGHISLGLAEKLLLKRIDRERIESFLLCDESAVGRTNDFLLEAGMEAVPQLLRFLYYEATRLELTIAFYVNIAHTREHMYYESSPVIIAHYLDIEETVDMLFSLLLEKISNYLLLQLRCNLEACSIKRLKLTVQRHWTNGELQLPLQYRVKNDVRRLSGQPTPPVDLALLTESYLSYQGQRFGYFPASLKVNLYSFRVCAQSKELYAVPYLLRSEDVLKTPTFIIQTDVTGEFRGLHEIRNVRRFLRSDSQDHVYECRRCQRRFAERAQFALHKQIDCGRGFVVSHLGEPATEMHENCLVLPKEYFKYAWYGLGHN